MRWGWLCSAAQQLTRGGATPTHCDTLSGRVFLAREKLNHNLKALISESPLSENSIPPCFDGLGSLGCAELSVFVASLARANDGTRIYVVE